MLSQPLGLARTQSGGTAIGRIERISASIAGRDGEYSGSWASRIDVEPKARFVELFETAARTFVRGTRQSGGRSGTWAIRVTR